MNGQLRSPAVAHLLCSFGYGGAELVAATLARRARARGERARIFGLRGGIVERSLWSEQGLALEGPIAQNPDEPGPRDSWRLAVAAAAELRREELIHAHVPWPDRVTTGLVGRGRRPAVLTFHLLPPEIPERDDQITGSWLPLQTRLAASARLAPLVLVGVTEADTARLRARFPRLRVEHVANAPVAAGDEPAISLPFGPGLRLLAVGRLSAQKGFDRLLRALASPAVASLPWTLCLLGDGAERPALERLAGSLGLADRVRFLGAVKAVGLYPQADIFLTTSLFEGMPLALLEAMTAGRFVLASPIAPHREVLAPAPDSLLPDREEDWPDALARAFTDAAMRDRVAPLLADRARLTYSQDAQEKAYQGLYRSLISGGRW
jgi:glycosyltransferase involved in cell wall biosynthesis